MKRLCVFAFSLLVLTGVAAEEVPAQLINHPPIRVSETVAITFSADTLDVHDLTTFPKETIRRIPARYETKSPNLYINLEKDPQSAGLRLKSGRYLLLYDGESVLFYDGDDRAPALIASPYDLGSGRRYFAITASSVLVEKNRVYDTSGFEKLSVGTPWAEGAKGNGQGESLDVSAYASQEVVKAIRIFLLNGFVSYDRPDLFIKNNRVRVLEVFEGEEKLTDVALADGARLQAFSLEISGQATLRFVVKEIYRGTLYNDTCLTIFLPLATETSLEMMPSPDE